MTRCLPCLPPRRPQTHPAGDKDAHSSKKTTASLEERLAETLISSHQKTKKHNDQESALDIENELSLPFDIHMEYANADKHTDLSWMNVIAPPAKHKPSSDFSPPPKTLVLDHIHGYSRGHSGRQNAFFFSRPDAAPDAHPTIVYPAGVHAVIRESNGAQRFFSGHHAEAITCLTLNPDAQGVVATGEAGTSPTLAVWSTKDQSGAASKASMTYKFPKNDPLYGKSLIAAGDGSTAPQISEHGIVHVCFTRDGHFLVCIVRFDDAERGFVFDWKHKPHPIHAFVVSSEYVFAVVPNPFVRRDFVTLGVSHAKFWQVDSAAPMSHNVAVHGQAGAFAAESEKQVLPTFCSGAYIRDKTFVTGSIHGDIYFWKPHQIDVVCEKMHQGAVYAVAAIDSPKYGFLSGGRDQRLLLWNTANQPVSEVSMGGEISTIDAGFCFGSWLGWGDTLGRKMTQALGLSRHSHASLDRRSKVDKQPLVVLVGCSDSTLWTVDLNDSVKESITESHDVSRFKESWGLDASRWEQQYFVTAGDDGRIKKWDLHDKKTKLSRTFDVKLRACAWAPLGNHVCAGDEDGAVYLLNDTLATALAPIKHRREAITAIKFSPNNRYIAVGSHEGFIDVYDRESDLGLYQRCLCCKGHSNMLTDFDWSADSQKLQSNCAGHELMFWSIDQSHVDTNFTEVGWETTTCRISWGTKGVYGKKSGGVTSLVKLRDISAIRHSDDLLVAGTQAGNLLLYRYPTIDQRSEPQAVKAHAKGVSAVVFADSGKALVSLGRTDGIIIQAKKAHKSSMSLLIDKGAQALGISKSPVQPEAPASSSGNNINNNNSTNVTNLFSPPIVRFRRKDGVLETRLKVTLFTGATVKESTIRFEGVDDVLASDVLRNIAEKQDLDEEYRHMFAIWVVGRELELQLKHDDVMIDVVSRWFKWNEKYTHSVSAGENPAHLSNEFMFVFKRALLTRKEAERKLKDENVINFLYGEAHTNIMSGKYPCTPADIVYLGGIQMQLQHGDADERNHTQGFLSENIRSFVPGYLGRYWPPGTWESHIFSEHKKFAGRTSLIMKMLYLQYVRQWPVYGSAFFTACRTPPPAGFFERRTERLLIAINADGIYVINEDKPTYIFSESWDNVNILYDVDGILIQYLSASDKAKKRDLVLITPQAPLINNIALKISMIKKRAIVGLPDGGQSADDDEDGDPGANPISKSLEMLGPKSKGKVDKIHHPSMSNLV